MYNNEQIGKREKKKNNGQQQSHTCVMYNSVGGTRLLFVKRGLAATLCAAYQQVGRYK